MPAAKRALKAAVWSAAGGFAFGWAAKSLSTPPPPSVEPPPPVVAVAPQDAPVKPPEGATVLPDGRIVTPLKLIDPASLVTSPGDPCAERYRAKKK
jgi:hypothetical protein